MRHNRIIKLMGTSISLLIEHENGEELLDQAEALLREWNDRFSANDAGSQLMQVNRNAGKEAVKVDPDLYELIHIAKKISLDSDRRFNLTIGPVVKLWKIGFKDAYIPTDKEVQDALKKTNPEKVQLNSDELTVYLEEEGMEIDLGAIAKGYFADRLKVFFKEQGVESGIVDLGGNVLLIGENKERDDNQWRVGVQHPKGVRGTPFGVYTGNDVSLVTSGIYERALKTKDGLYHHIFDSQTGYPKENDIAGLTIVSDISIDGEIWTTILFSLDAKLAMHNINQHPQLEGIIVTKDDKIFVSDGIKNKVQIL